MKLLSACAALAGAVGLAQAQPVVIESSSTIPNPPGVEFVGWQTALDGNEAVILGFESVPSTGGGMVDDTIASAYLFRRSGNTWTFVRKLAEGRDDNEDDADSQYPVAMKDGVLAMLLPQLVVMERINGQWVQQQFDPAPPGDGDSPTDPTPAEPGDIEIDGGRIFIGGRSWGGSVSEKNPATGNWIFRASLKGDASGDGDGAVGGPVDIAPNWAAVASPYNWDDLPAPAVQVFQRAGTSWPLNVRLVAPAGHSFGSVAITDSELFIGDYERFGVGVWRRNSAGQWAVADRLRTVSDFMNGWSTDGLAYGNALEKSAQLVFKQGHNWDRQETVVNVFQKDANNVYRHVAMLVPKAGQDLGGFVSPSGTGVLVGINYFQLPASFGQHAVFQDTFSTGNGTGWTPLAGSQFTAVQSGDSRLFRQASVAGDAGAVLDGHDWTDQSIQADVRPRAVNGADRWVGLATRRADASNYYYVALRSSGTIQLKRNRAGSFSTLASASQSWALDRTYRLRLESVGTLHRAYVDGVLVLEARDGDLKHGQAALLSFRAAADYDNVVLSPRATQTIYFADHGPIRDVRVPNPAPWTYAGGSWQWDFDSSNDFFRQTTVTGDARAVIGPERINNTAQAVQARVRANTFGASADPWFGLMARYQNTSNYAYLSLRRSNALTLRKVVNGSIVELGSLPFTVTPGTWYKLRLEAVGSQLRAYVNGRVRLEATDPQPTNGRVGLVGFRTAADYDDIRAAVP